MKAGCTLQQLAAAIKFCTLVSKAALSSVGTAASLFQPSLNASILDIPVSPHFKIRVSHPAGTALDETSYKMVALHMMGELALRDWDSSVPGAVSPPLPDFSSVFIVTGPNPPATQIPVRYIIWGLNLAMYRSITRRTFTEMTFDLLWDEQKIGVLGFQGVRQSPTLGLAPTTLGRENVRIEVASIPGSQTLLRDNVWKLLFAAMQHLAWADSRTILSHSIMVRPKTTDVVVIFTGENGPGLPRRTPPFLQYSTMIMALMQIPMWMVSEGGSFREVGFSIFSDNTLVGAGFVDLASRPGLLQLPSTLNASGS
ncbi:MAG: hypothetical protein Q9218_007377 [Villophora microphyllina]